MTTESSQIKQKKYCLTDNRGDETQNVLTPNTQWWCGAFYKIGIVYLFTYIYLYSENGHSKEMSDNPDHQHQNHSTTFF